MLGAWLAQTKDLADTALWNDLSPRIPASVSADATMDESSEEELPTPDESDVDIEHGGEGVTLQNWIIREAQRGVRSSKRHLVRLRNTFGVPFDRSGPERGHGDPLAPKRKAPKRQPPRGERKKITDFFYLSLIHI